MSQAQSAEKVVQKIQRKTRSRFSADRTLADRLTSLQVVGCGAGTPCRRCWTMTRATARPGCSGRPCRRLMSGETLGPGAVHRAGLR